MHPVELVIITLLVLWAMFGVATVIVTGIYEWYQGNDIYIIPGIILICIMIPMGVYGVYDMYRLYKQGYMSNDMVDHTSLLCFCKGWKISGRASAKMLKFLIND